MLVQLPPILPHPQARWDSLANFTKVSNQAAKVSLTVLRRLAFAVSAANKSNNYHTTALAEKVLLGPEGYEGDEGHEEGHEEGGSCR